MRHHCHATGRQQDKGEAIDAWREDRSDEAGAVVRREHYGAKVPNGHRTRFVAEVGRDSEPATVDRQPSPVLIERRAHCSAVTVTEVGLP
jgi:hypothetical protein